MLKDKDWKVRFFAVKALGEIASKDVEEELVAIWQEEENWQVLKEVAGALYKIDDGEKSKGIFENSFNSIKNDLYRKGLSAIILYDLSGEDKYFNFLDRLIRDKKEGEICNKLLFVIKSDFSKSPKIIYLIESLYDNFDDNAKKFFKDVINMGS